MSGPAPGVEQRIRLSPDRLERLRCLAQARQLSEDQIIEQALDILFSLTEYPNEQADRANWSSLSEDALKHVWDNDADSLYDNWKDIYGPPAR